MSRTALSPLIKAQVDKLTTTTTTASGQRFLDSSSPIIIPKKAICSNSTSSQSSSSYTSIADQMSSSAETFLQNHRDFDHVYTSLPMLPSTCEKLEHTAARDRIQVKNKRQQQRSKGKLNVVQERTVDDQSNVFASTPDEEEEEIIQSAIPTSTAPQITVDLADLDTARARLRATSRPRDRSADNILPSSTLNIPIQTSNVQRSVSFKRPQEINEAKYLHRTIRKIERTDDAETDKDPKRSTQEHIYDNLDIFKQKKINDKSDGISTTYSSSVNMREHAAPTTARLRPVTMHFSPTNEKQTPNEFENVFNQLKKRSSIKRVQPNEEKEKEEPERPTLPPPVKTDEPPTHVIKENESIAPVLVSTNKLTVTSSISQPPPNRRRTVGGVHLPGNNKVNTEESIPTPSWIDIAKQKQSKFQSVANEIEEQKTSVETVITSSKPMNNPSNTSRIQENISDESHANQKPKYEPIIVRRTPSAAAAAATHTVERDSIRALKANNSNRINNLIQFFDK